MKVVKALAGMRRLMAKAKSQGKHIGFVPTMGALHEGHRSLLQRCRRESTICVMSLFINPLQFGPKEDFKKYPRNIKKDMVFAQKAGVDVFFAPTTAAMYPNNFLTSIDVNAITSIMCGRHRPGHFTGVATVVGKLLNIVQPDVIYLGQKDAQQIVVLKKMIADLNFPVKVTACPTIREHDGLAMSSRNVFLTQAQRQESPVLYQSLKTARQRILAGERDPSQIILMVKNAITRQSSATLDYVVCVNADTLSTLNRLTGRIMIALAARFGRTRLIDNVILHAP